MMGGFDWIIAAILLVSILVGVMRGFIKESLSLISWILAVWLATTFSVEAGEFINQFIHIPNPKFRMTAGFALIFIGTLFAFAVISYVVIKIFVRGPIKGVDRVLGIGFGALRGAAIIVALLIFTRAAGFESSDWWANSVHIAKFEPLMEYAESLMPDDWRTELESEQSLQERAVDKVIKAQQGES
jgi:membrane protein required for colicin V production